jgi:hypothetical protein
VLRKRRSLIGDIFGEEDETGEARRRVFKNFSLNKVKD